MKEKEKERNGFIFGCKEKSVDLFLFVSSYLHKYDQCFNSLAHYRIK